MPERGRILERLIVVDEIGRGRRHVGRAHGADGVALQAVHSLRSGHQRLARRPQHVALAGLRVEADIDAAVGVAVVRIDADGIRVGRHDPGARIQRIGLEADHCGIVRLGERAVVIAAALVAALRQVHPAGAIEGDVGDHVGRRHRRRVDLDARIVGEDARGRVDPDRPDLRTAGDGVVETAAAHGQAVDHAGLRRVAPRRRVLDAKGRILDVGDDAIVGHRRETERGDTRGAVIEAVDRRARGVEPVDQAGIEIGNEELVRGAVEDDVAETRTAVSADRGKQTCRPGHAVDLVYAARSAAQRGAELPRHPVGRRLSGLEALRPRAARRRDLQTEGRRRTEIDVRHLRIVERDRKDLPDVLRLDLQRDGWSHELPLRRPRGLHLEDLRRDAFRIDERLVERIGRRRARNRHAGETGDDRFARLEHWRLGMRAGRADSDQRHQPRRRPTPRVAVRRHHQPRAPSAVVRTAVGATVPSVSR